MPQVAETQLARVPDVLGRRGMCKSCYIFLLNTLLTPRPFTPQRVYVYIAVYFCLDTLLTPRLHTSRTVLDGKADLALPGARSPLWSLLALVGIIFGVILFWSRTALVESFGCYYSCFARSRFVCGCVSTTVRERKTRVSALPPSRTRVKWLNPDRPTMRMLFSCALRAMHVVHPFLGDAVQRSNENLFFFLNTNTSHPINSFSREFRNFLTSRTDNGWTYNSMY